ncbi:MAG: phosphate ABC transporter permease subunit PstC [Bdellovibrio sp.]|nr:MAG: phosphate ABC transporter permease subunit PstC [Bdellovibrio sp.]
MFLQGRFLPVAVQKKSEVRSSDLAFLMALRGLALILILGFTSIVFFLYFQSRPLIAQEGLSFFWGREWSPADNRFGALPFIYGTLVTSALALLLASPVAVGSALFLTVLAPHWLRRPTAFLIEMLAAIPSVVYGLWGIFMIVPLVRTFQVDLQNVVGDVPLFSGPPLGVGFLAAGLILAIMILPTIASVCREVFGAVPTVNFEAALTLGATRWEALRMAVLRASVPGILTAVTLGLGRALGETMAVTMLVGNRAVISPSLNSVGATMASIIANEYPEAASDLHLSALTAVGLALFVISLLVNLGARWIGTFYRRKMGF